MTAQNALDYERIEKAIQFIENRALDRLNLDEMAQHVHISKYHFQRLFRRWAGVSPTQFMQYLTLDYTKEQLRKGHSLLDVSFDAGLSGPSRLHDLYTTFEAMTPGDFKKHGEGLIIEYGFHPTPFGECILAITQRGICHLRFISSRPDALQELRNEWPKAVINENLRTTSRVIEQLFAVSDGAGRPFHLLLKGTNFQVQVWQALLTIPEGTLLCYQDLAAYMGRSGSARAVSNAIAANPIAFLIPCHRVISKSGESHNYRWGPDRKKAIIGWEASRFQA